MAIPPAPGALSLLLLPSMAGQPSSGLSASGKALEKLEKPRLVGSYFAVLSMIHVCGLCGIYVFWIVLKEVLTEAHLLKLEVKLCETEKN